MPCRTPEWARRTLPVPVILKRLAAARLVFFLGMEGYSFVPAGVRLALAAGRESPGLRAEGLASPPLAAGGFGAEAGDELSDLAPGFSGFGINTAVRVRPSERGADSTVDTSASWLITFWISLWPIS